ncbi:hypothetical protein TWF694_007803 [Orbilia ellipsospora]|uniref:Calcineurin-like phosphoesterase domain-containing protein n=1 Tax=Orbilia ellipsospora TaxID=2528407 RepID=A0AAV9XM66_9PEZI
MPPTRRTRKENRVNKLSTDTRSSAAKKAAKAKVSSSLTSEHPSPETSSSKPNLKGTNSASQTKEGETAMDCRVRFHPPFPLMGMRIASSFPVILRPASFSASSVQRLVPVPSVLHHSRNRSRISVPPQYSSSHRSIDDEDEDDASWSDIGEDIDKIRKDIKEISRKLRVPSRSPCRHRTKHRSSYRQRNHTPSPPPPPNTVKTTFLIVSDTHNILPEKSRHRDAPFRTPFPKTDVFIHAGDMTQQGSLHALKKQIAWITDVPAELKIIIAGNHDCKLDTKYWVSQAEDSDDEKERAEESQSCRDYLLSPDMKRAGIYYLEDEIKEFSLRNGAKFTVLASPYTPRGPKPHHKGSFRYSLAKNYWFNKFPVEGLPERIHVAITHGPAYAVLDQVGGEEGGGHVGCEELWRFMGYIKPLMSVCGHIHEAGGVRKVEWRECENSSHKRVVPVIEDVGDEVEKVEKGGMLYNDARGMTGDVVDGKETFFVNASLVGHGSRSYDQAHRSPYVVELELPCGTAKKTETICSSRKYA